MADNIDRVEGIWELSCNNDNNSTCKHVYTTTRTIIKQWQQNHLTDPLFNDYFIPSAADPLDNFVLYRDFFTWKSEWNFWSYKDDYRNTLYMIFNE